MASSRQKKRALSLSLLLAALLLGGCAGFSSSSARQTGPEQAQTETERFPAQRADPLRQDAAGIKDRWENPDVKESRMQLAEEQKAKIEALGRSGRAEIYLAAGCFWGAEAYFKQVPGVLETEVGYANGEGEQVGYRDIPRTGHAETVQILYDPYKVKLAELLERYYRVIDPLSLNRQGNDQGVQYRTGIYYTDEDSGALARYSLEILAERLEEQPCIECEPLRNFTPAEDYHQDYLDKHPGGYCHIPLGRVRDILFEGEEQADDAELCQSLDAQTFAITRRKGTERPGSSPLDQTFQPGIYVDVLTGQPLFSSDDKYDAGCGWPSFTMPITTDAAVYQDDRSHGMIRTEVDSMAGNHLGHVFDDGPRESGSLRYCINGAALRFIPREEMEAAGYLALLPFVRADE